MKKKSKKTEDDIRFENYFNQVHLNLITDINNTKNVSNELSPEAQKALSTSIERCKSAFQNASEMTIHEKLNFPEFIKSKLMDQREVSEELKKVLTLLSQHHLHLNTLHPVDDYTLYDFITTEFMHHRILTPDIPHSIDFVYEAFHPNHESDIRELVTHIINTFLKKGEWEFSIANPYEIVNHKALFQFCHSFERFTIHHFNIDHIEINGEKAHVVFKIKFTGHIDYSSGKVSFEGEGYADLENIFNEWTTVSLKLPI